VVICLRRDSFIINEAKGVVEDVWQDHILYAVSVAMFCSLSFGGRNSDSEDATNAAIL
jgi:hypothetical protein